MNDEIDDCKWIADLERLVEKFYAERKVRPNASCEITGLTVPDDEAKDSQVS